jgi:hypothetical protein
VEVDIMPSDHHRSAPRAIVYARYSSDHQRDASIEDQIRECRAFIERQGWDYQHAYVDRALSGASTVRPGYQLMLEGARERQFDIAVAESLDRLSRDLADVATLFKHLNPQQLRSSSAFSRTTSEVSPRGDRQAAQPGWVCRRPRGKGWGRSTIHGNWQRGTGILHNEALTIDGIEMAPGALG